MTAEIKTVHTGTCSMEYVQFGHGDKPFVILPGLSVQSVMGAAAAVAAAYAMFAEEYTVYLFDRRKELPESYPVADMAKDTEDALRALGLSHVYLFGASQGGMMAMQIAIDAPELVEKLVLGSTAARIDQERSGAIEAWISLAEEKESEKLYLAFGEMVYPKEAYEQSKQLLKDVAKTVTEEDLRRFVILANGVKGFDVMQELNKIACPVLILGSRDDQVLGGEASEQMAAHLNPAISSELFLYEGYGHAAYDTAPDYKERMLQFFNK